MSLAVHHIAIRTDDVTGLAAFYHDMFGLIVARDLLPRALWLGLKGDAMLMIEKKSEGEPPPSRSSMEMFAFRVDEPGLRMVRQRAIDSNFFDGETEHTVYLRDPEGRRVAVSTFDLTGLQLVVGFTPG